MHVFPLNYSANKYMVNSPFFLSSSEADIPSTADCTFQSSLTLHRITLALVDFGGQSSIGGGEVRLKDGLPTLAMPFV